MATGRPLDRGEIVAALEAVDAPLSREPAERRDLVVVGGSYLALHGLRDTIDHEDMVKLWPRCSFENAEAAVERYREAFPAALHDEHLVAYVQTVVAAAE